MNNYKIKLVAGLISLTLMTGCSKKLLDLHPYDNIDLGQAFEKVSDAQQWDNGMYASLRGNVYGTYTMATDIQADLFNATLDYGNNYGFLQTWQGFLADDYTISGEWSAYYNAIANLNVALNGYKQIVPQSAQDTAALAQYTGDAYLARAYYYLQLVLRWSVAYNSSTAASDPGVPLVLDYNINALPARATVQQVYAQILSDIGQARSLLAGVAGSPGSATFTSDVVLALEARTKLYMQDWVGAQAAADSLINSGVYPLVTDQATFTSMWTNDLPNESILQLNASQPNEVPNANNLYLNFNAATGAFDPLYIPSQWVVDMYDPADIRRGTYFMDTSVIIQGNAASGIYLVSKYPGNPQLFTGATSNYEQAPKVFRIAEMYLISAEAAAQSGNASSALSTLNALRAARGVAAIGSAISADSVTGAVRAERFRELAFEGFRLDDLKRWNQGFTRHDPQDQNLLVPGPTYTSLSEPAGAPKYVWGIPSNDITINPHLVQNPGW
jgi:starch-binding outer membrane protein, SusD/RagB family